MANIKEVLEKQGYADIQKRLLISVMIMILTIIIFIVVYFFFFTKQCTDSACFSQSLVKCSRVNFIKEDSKASWSYTIEGASGKDSCIVKIELLKMNSGTIEIEDLQGTEMTCIVNKGDTIAPEENMKTCSGPLKEKLQEIIIERMHSYLLKNLGEIKESFGP